MKSFPRKLDIRKKKSKCRLLKLLPSMQSVNEKILRSLNHFLEYFQLLNQQQEGLQHLIDIVKEDTKDLNLIDQGLADTSAARRWHSFYSD